jgi:hypothetical protein
MPRGKQFDIVEKTKMLAWFHEGITLKVFVERLQRNVKAVRKVINANKDLPVQATPPLAKKRSGRPRLSSAAQENRLRRYLTAHPFKTAKELKTEVAGWSNVSVRTNQTVCQKRLGMPSRCAAKKPLLMEKIVRKKHRAWTETD